MPILLSLFASHATAAEVQFDGFYRARLRAFDKLALDSTLAPTGAAALTQHRLWLQPKFLLTDDVAVFVQIRGFDDLTWGTEPATVDAGVPNVFEYDLNPPTATDEPTNVLLDLSLWRAWGEVYTKYGQFSFGRVPLQWGSGVWLNDGLSVDPLYADYGDTTDRVMWEHLIDDQFYLRLSVDTVAERLLDSTRDDTTAVGLAAAYRSESLTAGLTAQLDHTGADEGNGNALDVFTVDGAADVTLGKLSVAAEVAGQFGSGRLAGGDVNIAAVGASLDAHLDLDPFRVEARAGFASGDGSDPNSDDRDLRTFTFDRDYSVGMFLFEQPLITVGLDDTTQDPIQMGNAVSNAIFLKPTLSRQIVDGLRVEASWLGARVARAPKLGNVSQSRSYGNEIQLGATYDGIQHFTVDGRLGAFIPGTQYTRNAAATAGTDFTKPILGAQLTGQIKF